MKKISKVVLLKGDDTNWGHASEQIALELEKQGFDTYFVDYRNLIDTIAGLPAFIGRDKVALITFNFKGIDNKLYFQDEDGESIWRQYDMVFLNILTDHPSFFNSLLVYDEFRSKIFCIDNKHLEYLKTYYPKKKAYLLSMAGNIRTDFNMNFLGDEVDPDSVSYGIKYRDYERILDYEYSLKPIYRRQIDLAFIGNYVPVQNLLSRIDFSDDFTTAQMKKIIKLMGSEPEKAFDEILIEYLEDGNEKLEKTLLRDKVAELNILNLCLRTMYREKIIRTLADSDIRVNVYGNDWDMFKCKKPWNIIRSEGRISSCEAVKVIQDTKISLNIMPLVKNGFHERVLTAMLQKAVPLTDHSEMLDETFVDGENIAFYDIRKIGQIPKVVNDLLDEPAKMQRIADSGYVIARDMHMWKNRVPDILKHL
ncbi:Glycosyl transferases group 1 [Lachnospiraceae bacterium C7]|nr:Glycosyl transferases group 1 [Lachnospiraceae bacterium C7]